MHLSRILKLRPSYYQKIVLVASLFIVGIVFGFLSMAQTEPTSAASFNPGNIISDAVMANYNSMSVSDIQSFLTSKNPCNNTNYGLYLDQSSRYKTVSWHWSDGHFVCLSQERFGEGTEIGQGQTAAEIIYEAAQTYRINPQVLIVLLEKEQGLITDTYPHSGQYRAATGYGCPDTAACDSKYYGFKNQVFRAAELFRYTLDHGSALYPDNRQGVYVAYNPSSSCGGTNVYIENRATSALYRYTPYQPNAAALSAGYGMGDACSAYGNRNFYLYFTDWFGSTQAASAKTVQGDLINIPDGEYLIATKSTSPQRTLAAPTGNAQLAATNSSDQAQRWRIQSAGSSQYHIINIASGQYLTVNSSQADNGTNVYTSAYSNQCTQRWSIYRTPDDNITFASACSNSAVLDVFYGGSNVGTNVQVWTTDGGIPQKWHLLTGQTISDGIYIIAAQSNQNIALDITGAGQNNGTNVGTWQNHGGLAQRWYAEYHADRDAYTFTNPNSGKNLNLNGSAGNGTNITIQSPSSSCSQYWKVLTNLDGSRSLLSTCRYGYLASATSINNGGNVQLTSTQRNANEKWVLQQANQPVRNGTYIIASKRSDNVVLDVEGARTSEGTNVEIWSNHGNLNQQWRLTYNVKTDDYTVIDRNSGKALDLYTGIPSAGQNINIWNSNGRCNQRWRLVPQGNYYIMFSSCDSTYAIDISNGNLNPGNNLWLWYSNGTDNQLWKFIAR